MFKIAQFYFIVVVAVGMLAASVQAASLQVDLGATGQNVQAGWTPLTNNDPNFPAPLAVTSDFAAVGSDVTINFGFNRWRDRGDIGGALGDVIEDFAWYSASDTTSITFSNLAAGDYELTGYHNDHPFPGQFKFSASSISGATASDLTGAQGIVSGTLTPVTSLVSFSTDGSSDVEIFYTRSNNLGVVFNGIQLDGVVTSVPLPAATWMALPLLGGLGATPLIRRRRLAA